MTDNEKRAHDLAVAVCIDTCRRKADIEIANGNEKIVIDYIAEYVNAYNTILENFNDKFPNGK